MMRSFLSCIGFIPFFFFNVAAMPSASKATSCSIAGANLQLPSNQTQLTVPSGQTPRFITVGSGVQNYTCSSTGKYGSIGALATLYDVSCLAKSPILTQIPEIVYDASEAIPSLSRLLGKTPFKLGQHLFITNPVTDSGIVPRFDFAASQGSPNAFVDTTKTGDVVAVSNPESNIDWLQLEAFLGDLAKTVFRVNTKAGQPPTSCTPGTSVSVPYAALYWVFA